jgi:AcrR family transcriptional regulator
MKSQDRRAAIVAAAVELFAAKGFRGATTRELAARVGVTEPVLYQHFRDKRDLYSAIIETKAQEGSEKAADLIKYAEGEDDRRFLTALAELILGRYHEDPALVRLVLFSGLEGHELADLFFRRQVMRFYEMVAGYIRRRIRQGAFRPMDATVAARGFIGMISYHGLVQVVFHVKKANRKKLIQEMVTTFLKGVAAHA